MDGDGDVRVDASTLNHKSGGALTGRAPVVRTWPLTPGIEFVGVVGVRITQTSKPETGSS